MDTYTLILILCPTNIYLGKPLSCGQGVGLRPVERNPAVVWGDVARMLVFTVLGGGDHEGRCQQKGGVRQRHMTG